MTSNTFGERLAITGTLFTYAILLSAAFFIIVPLLAT
jgi:hypothetical protein